jgi:hypothetical protein
MARMMNRTRPECSVQAALTDIRGQKRSDGATPPDRIVYSSEGNDYWMVFDTTAEALLSAPLLVSAMTLKYQVPAVRLSIV